MLCFLRRKKWSSELEQFVDKREVKLCVVVYECGLQCGSSDMGGNQCFLKAAGTIPDGKELLLMCVK